MSIPAVFQLPRQTPLQLGQTVPGALAYFFAAGTTTPQATYTTAALDTQHAHPVEADASGLFPIIYLDDELAYRVQIKTAADVLIYDEDDINDPDSRAPFYDTTPAEDSAGVTPVNKKYRAIPHIDLRRHWTTGDASSGIRDMFAVAKEYGGGVLNFLPGKTLTVTQDASNNWCCLAGTVPYLVINGNGCTISCADFLQLFRFVSCNVLILRDITFVGPGGVGSTDKGGLCQINSTTLAIAINVGVNDGAGDGLVFSSCNQVWGTHCNSDGIAKVPYYANLCNRVWFLHNYAANFGGFLSGGLPVGAAIQLSGNAHARVAHGTFKDGVGAGVIVAQSGAIPPLDTVVELCDISGVRNPTNVETSSAVRCTNSSATRDTRTVVRNNEIEDCGQFMVYANKHDGIKVYGNNGRKIDRSGVVTEDCRDPDIGPNDIANWDQDGNGSQAPVYLDGTTTGARVRSPRWRNTLNTTLPAETTLDVNEVAGDTELGVADTTNFTAGRPVVVRLDDNTDHQSVIVSVNVGVSITIRDPLPSNAASGNAVGANTSIAGVIDASSGVNTVEDLQTEHEVSSDRGDASVTLIYGRDAYEQRFDTTLTANRTVTLSTTRAFRGAKFKVVRTGLGSFTLDVGGLKTIPSATAAFVEVTYNGSAWVLAGYGAL